MQLLVYSLATYQSLIEYLAVIVTVLILISGLDDLFIDLWYWGRSFYRWYWVRAFRPRMTAEQLDDTPERPIAIMVPAWQESPVIQAMLQTSNRLIRYKDYRIFVGVYQNDPDTISEVQAAMQRFDNVSMSVVPRDGPTSKADCLNVVLTDIFDYERQHNIRFAGIALHDSEDVIHPYELKLFNFLLDRMDLIQLPVFSFARRASALVAGTYMDEFAEWHSKDLVVREYMTGIVPCAGVSACFSRRALQALAAERAGEIFSTTSLTEDYDIAFRLNKMGMREIFVRFPVGVLINQHGEAGTVKARRHWVPIATREYFPSEFRAAYRQRARWLLGIAFQGWAQHGWSGNWGERYFLLRDRKGVVTSPLPFLAYFVAINIALLELFFAAAPPSVRPYYALLTTDWYTWLLVANVWLLVNRLFHRMLFTARLYGPLQCLLAAPRMFISNLLNFFATARAVNFFIRHKITGKPIAWDKTTHAYPFKLDPVPENFSARAERR